MTDRRNMAQTVMIDFRPEKPVRATPPLARKPGRRIVVRRPGQPQPRIQASVLPLKKTTALSNELISFFEGIYDAALLTDMDGDIIDANVRAVQFFGYTREHFKGRTIGDIIPGIGPSIMGTIKNNLQNNQFTLLQSDCQRSDGTAFPAEISTSEIDVSDKQFLCFFVRDISVRRTAEEALKQAHDELAWQVEESNRANLELKQEITERKRIEDELTTAITRLQKHDEAKSEFISNVSHEFRTPLTSMKYVTDNMLRGIAGDMTPKAKDYLLMLLADCDRLARTVEDILDMSRIDADTLKMHWVRAPLGRMVKRTVDSLRVQAEKGGLGISCVISPEALFATCDVQKMERVILNVVKNAIKFSASGGQIEVLVEPARTSNAICIKVCDTGPGIPPEHIGRVTERYYRVGEYVSGTGLGLAICKELIAFHNGILDIQSPVPGTPCGTQVTVMLPRAEPPQVFLLNTTDEVRQALSGELQGQGYALREDPTGTGLGPDPQDVQQPAVIVVDWTAPDMRAAIMLAQLKMNPAYAQLPLLVLIGTNRDAARDEILQGLGVAVLQVPANQGDVANVLEGMIPDLPDENTKHGAKL